MTISGSDQAVRVVSAETSEDIEFVAALHRSAIPMGFLSSLDPKALKVAYRAISKSRYGILIVARNADGRNLGFIAASTAPKLLVAQSVVRHFPSFLPRAIRALFTEKSVVKVVETACHLVRGPSARSRSELPTHLPKAEFMMLAVAPSAWGLRVSDALFDRLLREMASRGIHSFISCVGEDRHMSHRFHKQMGFTPVGQTEVHAGQITIVYRIDVPDLVEGPPPRPLLQPN